MQPILITGALQSEIDYIIEKMENVKKSKLLIYDFYEGIVEGYPVCLIKTEVGVINASTALTLAIEKCNPQMILNEGTAGGITPKHHKKDIVIAEEVFNIMACKTPYKELGEGSNSLEWEMISFIDGKNDIREVFKADKKLVEFVYNLKDIYKNGEVYKGISGSGDVWNREKDKLKYLSDVYDVSCEDMESIAIYKVASNYKIPVLGIKIMSDNELLREDYEPEVATFLQEYFYEVLKELVRKIK